MQIVYRAGDVIEAHIVANMLEAQDIHTYVGGHYLQGGVGETIAFGFANVWVEDDEVAQAKKLITHYEQAEHAVNSELPYTADHDGGLDPT